MVRRRSDGSGTDLGTGRRVRLANARTGAGRDAGLGLHDLSVRPTGRERGFIDGGQLPVLRTNAHRLHQRGADLAGVGARGRSCGRARRPRCHWSTAQIEGLAWNYNPRGTQAPGETARSGLHEVSLALRRGERIALVRPSGGGKSTLLRVLAGLYAPHAGTVVIDGQPQPWSRLRTIATLIPQETEVFEASVRENLGFGQPFDDEELRAAMHVSTFDDVLKATHGELDTPLSERGFNLSGGQRQRLCLARGVLAAQGSSLLLLDEPTSALDAATEGRVLERIGAAFPDACVIASIHRLSLIDRFDTVVLMEAGKIVDAGPRSALLARQPSLRKMLTPAISAPC